MGGKVTGYIISIEGFLAIYFSSTYIIYFCVNSTDINHW